MKYIIQIFSLYIIAVIIQPKWLIDENASIFRNEIWFKPPIAPTRVEIIINTIIIEFISIK